MPSDVIDDTLGMMFYDGDDDLLIDRRRPGRQEVRPALLPLLRGPVEGIEIPRPIQGDLTDEGWEPAEIDPVGPAKGLALGLLLSIPLWGIIGAVAYLAFR